MIDISCSILFGWTAQNIPFQQKVVSYAHLYSASKLLSIGFRSSDRKRFRCSMTKPLGAFLGTQVNSTRLQNSPQKISILLLPSSTAASTHWLSISPLMPLLILSIDVMLAQLPPHTVAKKVENYEHLDLLWGQDVDKVVFPHVCGSWSPGWFQSGPPINRSRSAPEARAPIFHYVVHGRQRVLHVASWPMDRRPSGSRCTRK